MITIKALSQLLEDKKTNHTILSSGTYYFGDPWEFGADNTIVYPFMGARLLPSGNSLTNTINGADNVTSVEIFFCDLVQKDESDETQTLSDLQLITLDIYSQVLFDLKNYYKANLDDSATLNPFTERFDDEVTGWSIVLNIRQFYDKSTCDNISNGNAGKVIIYDSEGNIVQILNPNSVYYLDPMYTEVLETFTLTGAANTTQALANTPNFIFGVYKNGQKLRGGASDDYTISGAIITFLYALTSDKIDVVYNY